MDIATIEQVVERVARSQVQQVTIEDGMQSITVTNRLKATPITTANSTPSRMLGSTHNNPTSVSNNQINDINNDVNNSQESQRLVTSTHVGYVQLGADAGSDALVQVGDIIDEGQTVAYVDVLSKLLPVRSKHAGEVAEVLLYNGDTVQYGQAIFRLV